MVSPRAPVLAVLLGLIGLISFAPSPGWAQEEEALPWGARVRLRTEPQASKWIVGTFLSWHADSIRIRPDSRPDPESFPVGSISRLEVSRGQRSNAGKGATTGLLVGAGTGLALGIAAAAEGCEGDCYFEVEPHHVLVVMGMLGAVGAGIGALIGTASRSERWKPVSPPRGSVSALPHVGFGVMLRFRS